ncbi:MAG: CaiB/BaiF CoA-transferase family protein [Myxococcota bacterium]|nr:CaiB/BaiF CoA-transferase family protein [Myxococcota bacterium]
MTQGESEADTQGALSGVKVLELRAIGPAPFAVTLLAEMGAEVLQVSRGEGALALPTPSLSRGRVTLSLDLKAAECRPLIEALIQEVDVLIEGFRPGVMERLGLGPEHCLALNPRLIYGRMTGWGQSGPLAEQPGHDLNYIALSGALDAIGPPQGAPVPPLNLLGDFGGGALYLAMGVCAALVEQSRSGRGQVIDCAMLDGVNSLLKMESDLRAAKLAGRGRGENLLDGGAPFYTCYETADGKYFSVAALEPKFYTRLREVLSLDAPCFERQWDRSQWAAQRAALREIFLQESRDEWSARLERAGACCAPVLSLEEAPLHPHSVARNRGQEIDGTPSARPAPRFSRSSSSTPPLEQKDQGALESLLCRWDLDEGQRAALLQHARSSR